MKLLWKKADRDYISSHKDLVFKLKYNDIGVYGYGKSYDLQVRKKTDVKFEYLDLHFVIKNDGHHAISEYSVDGKQWASDNRMLERATELLIDNIYLEKEC